MNRFMAMQQAEDVRTLIEELVLIPSPSGSTTEVISKVEAYFEDLGIRTERLRKGGLLAELPGREKAEQRMMTAHVDTLGAMVKEVKSDGRLKLDLIGGFLYNAVEGEYCEIETAGGERYTGTILMKQTSVHVYDNAGKAERSIDNMEVRIDEKTSSKEETEALGIGPGDFISFDPRVQVLPNGYIKSRHLDDKASVAVLMRLAKEIMEEAIELPYTVQLLISNNEEIGFGGNAGIRPETVEYLAVDMGAMGDGQTTDEHTVSICAKDSGGPYHLGLRKHLVELAEVNSIGYQVDMYPHYGSDATAAVRAGHDVIHGLVGPGIDSSHAYERTHIESLEATYRLLKAYVQSPMRAY
ncbi:M42 family metallopeptidase [Alkalicoccus luteus]|nr:M42 family metallopeptidase [Alkalicoccus luteus]